MPVIHKSTSNLKKVEQDMTLSNDKIGMPQPAEQDLTAKAPVPPLVITAPECAAFE